MFEPHKLSEVKPSLFPGLRPKARLASADSQLRFSRYLELCPSRGWTCSPGMRWLGARAPEGVLPVGRLLAGDPSFSLENL